MATVYTLKGNILKPVKDDLKAHKLYKAAKQRVEHLEAINKVLNLTLSALARWEIYSCVANILATIRLEKKMIDINLEQCRKIVESKGK